MPQEPGEIRQWHDLPFVTPFPLEVNTRYIATVLHPQGRYSMTLSYYGGPASTRPTVRS